MSTDPCLDFLALKKMKSREKAALLRQRLIDLGVDVECRRIRGSVLSSGRSSKNGVRDEAGYRLPPAHELEILFTNSPLLCLVWDHFLLRVWPQARINFCRQNLRVNKVKLGKSEAERLKVERKKERDELLGKLEATNQYIALKTKKLEYIAMKMIEEEAVKSRQKEAKARTSVSSTNLERLSQSLASQFARGEREESDKWQSTARKLEEYRHALKIAGGGGEGVGGTDATASNDFTDCLSQLRAAFQAIKTEIYEKLPNGSSSSTESDKGVTDLSLEFSKTETESGECRHLDLLQSILRSHSRADIIAALLEETQSKSRLLKRSEANAAFLDPSEASALDCSMDESGIIIDESARRDEKELKQKKDNAKKQLQFKIMQIEDEAASCFQRAHEAEATRLKSFQTEPDSLVRAQALAASKQVLTEEIVRLQQFVDQVADEELELKKKRQNVADVQDAMKLTENIMAALIKDLNQRRHLTIGLCEEAFNSLDSSGVKEAAKEIGVKSGALEKYGHEMNATWTALRLENLPTQRVDSDAHSTDGVTIETGAALASNSNTATSTLVREVDVAQFLSPSSQKALSRLSILPRQSTPSVLESLTKREDECRKKEERLSSRPKVFGLEELEEAERVWEGESDVGNKENYSLSNFKDKSSSVNASSFSRSALGNSTFNSTNNSCNSTRNGVTSSEESLKLANQLTGRVMERCVSLAAAEKTHAEEKGFEALDNKIEGKNWTQWKAELQDAVTRHELERKARARDNT